MNFGATRAQRRPHRQAVVVERISGQPQVQLYIRDLTVVKVVVMVVVTVVVTEVVAYAVALAVVVVVVLAVDPEIGMGL